MKIQTLVMSDSELSNQIQYKIGFSLNTQSFIQAWMKENIKAPRHWPLCGEFTGTGEFPAQRASNAEIFSIWWRHHVSVQTNHSSGRPRRVKTAQGRVKLTHQSSDWTSANFVLKKTYSYTLGHEYRVLR